MGKTQFMMATKHTNSNKYLLWRNKVMNNMMRQGDQNYGGVDKIRGVVGQVEYQDAKETQLTPLSHLFNTIFRAWYWNGDHLTGAS